jgi:hypothetical protein
VEKLAPLLSRISSLVVGMVVVSLLLTSRAVIQWRYCSRHGGARGVVAAYQLPCPVWLACCRRGLRPGTPFLRGEVVMSLYRESDLSRIPLPRPLGVGSGA